MKIITITIGLILLAALAIVTAIVEAEADYKHEVLSSGGNATALVLFHPSRDAHFSDELSLALADGLQAAGYSVHRATLTRDTPNAPKGYALVAVVCNTYWWSPDLPTQRYLARARLDDIPTIGLIGGAGATGRSEQMLKDALQQTRAKVLQTRSLWTMRPNDEARSSEPNRQVAMQLAKQLGIDAGRIVQASGKLLP
jgi:hypothetical protein